MNNKIFLIKMRHHLSLHDPAILFHSSPKATSTITSFKDVIDLEANEQILLAYPMPAYSINVNMSMIFIMFLNWFTHLVYSLVPQLSG